MNRLRIAVTIFSFLILLGVSSCLDTPESFNTIAQLESEIAAIDKHLTDNPPNGMVLKDPTGIRIVINELGDKLPALRTDQVNVNYQGTYLSGEEFDKGTDKTFTLSTGVIQGWTIAFGKIPQGSKATIYIPSYYGYGPSGWGSIPANTTIVFNVDFLGIERDANFKEKLRQDTVAIKQYLTTKEISAERDTTGVYYKVTEQGVGPIPTWYSQLKLNYSFKLLTDDTKTLVTVEREPTETFFSRTVDYLQGMTAVLLKMPEGSKVTAYLPSGVAFGTTGAVDSNNQLIIPANAIVIVEMELKDVQ